MLCSGHANTSQVLVSTVVHYKLRDGKKLTCTALLEASSGTLQAEDSLHDQKGFALILQPMQVIRPRNAHEPSSVHSMHQICLMLHRLVLPK